MATTVSPGNDYTAPAAFVSSAPPLQPPPTGQGTLGNHESIVNSDETMNIQTSTLPHQSSLRRRRRQNIENPGPSRDQNFYLPLYKAALKGDWETANAFLEDEPDAVTARITAFEETALHVAAGSGNVEFVKNLMERMNDLDLEMRDHFGHTALFSAVLIDNIDAAIALVLKNPHLTQIANEKNMLPVNYAPLYGGKEITKFLCSVTTNDDPSPFFESESGSQLINDIIGSGFYDVALDLLHRFPKLAVGRDQNGKTTLDTLAQRRSAFKSGSRLGYLQRCIYSCVSVQVENPRSATGRDEENISENPQSPTGRDIENPSDIPQHHTGRDVENLSENPQHHTGRDVENLSESFLSRSNRGLQLPYLAGIQILNDVLWNFAKRVSIIKQVHDTKLMHKQALDLLKFICEQISLSDSSQIIKYFLNSNILSIATQNGIVELIEECIQYFPDLIWMKTEKHSIFHVAVLHRQEKIFNLIYGMSANRNRKLLLSDIIDGDNNLHMAARLAPSPQLNSVSGTALQMQRELQWFKEVEKIVDPRSKELKNSKEKETPRDLFSEQHKNLLEKGGKWMKDTASSCMVVAALIATVVFAAAFTVPGGNINDKGIPVFLHNKYFIVFMISDAIGLFCSCSSVLMFLYILTARYSEEDFFKSLPKKLIIGLTTLFISMAAMVIAFGATLVIVLLPKMEWVVYPAILFVSLTVALFGWLHFPLFWEMLHSTYLSGIFHLRGEHVRKARFSGNKSLAARLSLHHFSH